MKLLFRIFLLAGILYTSLNAQEDVLRPERGDIYQFSRLPIVLGFEGGINFNFFNQKFAWNQLYLHGNIYDPIQSGEGISPHFGVMADIPISKTIGFQIRLAYDQKDFGKTATGFDYDTLGRQHDMNLEVNVTSAFFTVTPLLRVNITDNLFVTVGPTIHTQMGKIETTWKPTVMDDTHLNSFSYWNYISGGSGFTNKGSYTLQSSDDEHIIPRIGLEAGIGYKINLAKAIYLVPQARLQLFLSNFSKNTTLSADNYTPFDPTDDILILNATDKTLHSLQIALALWFEI